MMRAAKKWRNLFVRIHYWRSSIDTGIFVILKQMSAIDLLTCLQSNNIRFAASNDVIIGEDFNAPETQRFIREFPILTALLLICVLLLNK